MSQLSPDTHSPEIEPNLSFLPYVAIAYAAVIITCLVLWSTGVIKPVNFFNPHPEVAAAPHH